MTSHTHDIKCRNKAANDLRASLRIRKHLTTISDIDEKAFVDLIRRRVKVFELSASADPDISLTDLYIYIQIRTKLDKLDLHSKVLDGIFHQQMADLGPDGSYFTDPKHTEIFKDLELLLLMRELELPASDSLEDYWIYLDDIIRGRLDALSKATDTLIEVC